MALNDHAAKADSLRCDVRAELVVVSTIEELERANCEGKLLHRTHDYCRTIVADNDRFTSLD